MGEKKRERSVLNFRDWLKEEVRIRVEAVEMVHGVVDKDDGKRAEGSGGRGRLGERGYGRSYFSGGTGSRVVEKPPCALCAGNHGVWSRKKFQGLSTEADGMLRRKSTFVLGAWEMTTEGDCAQDRRCVTSMVVRGIIITSCMTRHQ